MGEGGRGGDYCEEDGGGEGGLLERGEEDEIQREGGTIERESGVRKVLRTKRESHKEVDGDNASTSHQQEEGKEIHR